ncbi:hypothetical protein [Streptomyces sp. CAU 1734]|uniref:hypothetical protein n=1 Tax=Streptomyces sp. CAU 1734 TaxID=3140360 RepID=UPI0032619F12
MTVPPDLKPHMDAVTAALSGAGLVVGQAAPPATIPPTGIYAALFFDPGQTLTESLANRKTDFTLTFQVTYAGPTQEKTMWAAQRGRIALFPRLTVAGRSAWRVEELGGPPVQRDDDVTPPVYYLPVQYRLQTTS